MRRRAAGRAGPRHRAGHHRREVARAGTRRRRGELAGLVVDEVEVEDVVVVNGHESSAGIVPPVEELPPGD